MIKKYVKKDGSYAYRIRVYVGKDNKNTCKYKSISGVKSYDDARFIELKLRLSYGNLSFDKSVSSSILFSDLLNLWLEYYQPLVKKSTYARTKQIIQKYVSPVFNQMSLISITSYQCQQLINNISSQTSSAYCSLIVNYLKRIFLFAIKLKFLKENPLNPTIIPIKKETILTRKNIKFY